MSTAGNVAASDRIEVVLGRLVRRVRWIRFGVGLLRWGGLASLGAGCAVLLVRVLFVIEPEPRLAFALPIVLALGLGVRRLVRAPFDRAAAATWLDVELGGSGAFVTDIELADPRWSARFAHLLEGRAARDALRPVPRLAQPLGLALAGFAFLWASLFVEVPRPRSGPSPELVPPMTAALGSACMTILRSAICRRG